MQNLAAELNISEYVDFLGFVSDSVLVDYLSTADIGLAPDPPDRMNQLSTMTKIMEYMACQRPIVSFDLLETRRSAGDAACYVPSDDPKLFAEMLIELLDDEERRARMGKVGLNRSRDLVVWIAREGRCWKAILGWSVRRFNPMVLQPRKNTLTGYRMLHSSDELLYRKLSLLAVLSKNTNDYLWV